MFFLWVTVAHALVTETCEDPGEHKNMLGTCVIVEPAPFSSQRLTCASVGVAVPSDKAKEGASCAQAYDTCSGSAQLKTQTYEYCMGRQGSCWGIVRPAWLETPDQCPADWLGYIGDRAEGVRYYCLCASKCSAILSDKRYPQTDCTASLKTCCTNTAVTVSSATSTPVVPPLAKDYYVTLSPPALTLTADGTQSSQILAFLMGPQRSDVRTSVRIELSEPNDVRPGSLSNVQSATRSAYAVYTAPRVSTLENSVTLTDIAHVFAKIGQEEFYTSLPITLRPMPADSARVSADEYEQELKRVLRGFLTDAGLAGEVTRVIHDTWKPVSSDVGTYLAYALMPDAGAKATQALNSDIAMHPEQAFDGARRQLIALAFLRYARSASTLMQEEAPSYAYQWSTIVKKNGPRVTGERVENVVTQFFVEQYGNAPSAGAFGDFVAGMRRYQHNHGRYARTVEEWVEGRLDLLWEGGSSAETIKAHNRMVQALNKHHIVHDFPLIKASGDARFTLDVFHRSAVVTRGGVQFTGGHITTRRK